MRKLFFSFLVLLCVSTDALSADLRCQGDLMTPGTIMPKVRKKCGEPMSEIRVGEITVASRNGEEKTLYITEMTYEMNSGYYVLTFEGGELKNTEYYPY